MDYLKLYYDLSASTYTLEVWGASTKHPDCVNTMKHDRDNGNFTMSPLGTDVSLFQWLLYVASNMIFPTTSEDIVELAMMVRGLTK